MGGGSEGKEAEKEARGGGGQGEKGIISLMKCLLSLMNNKGRRGEGEQGGGG